MEQTLQALGGLLLKAIPTVLLVIILHFYLKRMLFAPLHRVLEKRRHATEGARRLADEIFAKADQKAEAYAAAIQQARFEIYKEQEQVRQKWLAEQAQHIEEARRKAAELTEDVRAQVDEQAAEARESLIATSESLAEEIATSLLGGRAA